MSRKKVVAFEHTPFVNKNSIPDIIKKIGKGVAPLRALKALTNVIIRILTI